MLTAANAIPITVEMLTGETVDLIQRMIFQSQAYQQINICAMKVWRSLPTSGAKSEELSGIGQGPDEL